METRLILVRHGETKQNVAKVIQGQEGGELTQKGREQAKAVGRALLGLEIDAVYCSDLKRTKDTLSLFPEVLKKNVTYTNLLRERYFGKYEGYPRNKIVGAFFDETEFEPLEIFNNRGIYAINEIIRKSNGKTSCLVAHGGINKAIFNYLISKFKLDFSLKYFSNCGITELLITGKSAELIRVNDISHLESITFPDGELIA